MAGHIRVARRTCPVAAPVLCVVLAVIISTCSAGVVLPTASDTEPIPTSAPSSLRGATAGFSWSPVEARCTGPISAPGFLSGRRALIVVTSHSKLGDSNCKNCKATGVYPEELTAPYYMFTDAGMDVTVATVEGGRIPFDPTYNSTLVQSQFDKRWWKDPAAYDLSQSTPSIATLDFASFDIVFMAGGWGAAWDLGTSDVLAAGVSAAYAKGRQLGSVCHGALGFIRARKPDGSPLCAGKRMTGVTNRQIKLLGIASITPQHPEDELIKAGAEYHCTHGVLEDITKNNVQVDGNIVTGQNQMASCQVPQLLMKQLASTEPASAAGETLI